MRKFLISSQEDVDELGLVAMYIPWNMLPAGFMKTLPESYVNNVLTVNESGEISKRTIIWLLEIDGDLSELVEVKLNDGFVVYYDPE